MFIYNSTNESDGDTMGKQSQVGLRFLSSILFYSGLGYLFWMLASDVVRNDFAFSWKYLIPVVISGAGIALRDKAFKPLFQKSHKGSKFAAVLLNFKTTCLTYIWLLAMTEVIVWSIGNYSSRSWHWTTLELYPYVVWSLVALACWNSYRRLPARRPVRFKSKDYRKKSPEGLARLVDDQLFLRDEVLERNYDDEVKLGLLAVIDQNLYLLYKENDRRFAVLTDYEVAHINLRLKLKQTGGRLKDEMYLDDLIQR